MVSLITVISVICAAVTVMIWVAYDNSLSVIKNLSRVKGLLLLCVFCSAFSLYCFDFTGFEISDICLRKYALTSESGYVGIIMNNFIHYDKFHLGIDMLMLVFLYFIELRNGTLLYLCAFLIPSIVQSAVFTLILPDKMHMLGSSVGIAGLIGVMVVDFLQLPNAVARKSGYARILNFILGIVIVSGLFLLTKRPRYLNIYSYLAHVSGAGMTYLCVSVVRRFRV